MKKPLRSLARFIAACQLFEGSSGHIIFQTDVIYAQLESKIPTNETEELERNLAPFYLNLSPSSVQLRF